MLGLFDFLLDEPTYEMIQSASAVRPLGVAGGYIIVASCILVQVVLEGDAIGLDNSALHTNVYKDPVLGVPVDRGLVFCSAFSIGVTGLGSIRMHGDDCCFEC